MKSNNKWKPSNLSFNTHYEHEFLNHLENELLQISDEYKIIRNEDKYGVDGEVYKFNFESNTFGDCICCIELERKLNKNKWLFKYYPTFNTDYSKGKSLHDIKGKGVWSTLHRKVDNKEKFYDDDVYVLIHPENIRACFWTTFEIIRNHFQYYEKNKDRYEKYWRKLIQDSDIDKIFYGIKNLAQYIKTGKIPIPEKEASHQKYYGFGL